MESILKIHTKKLQQINTQTLFLIAKKSIRTREVKYATFLYKKVNNKDLRHKLHLAVLNTQQRERERESESK